MSCDIIDLLMSVGGRERSLGPTEHLFHLGEPVVSLLFVLEGDIHLIRHHEAGGAVILQRAGPGEVLAEASLFSATYHCDAVARTSATVGDYVYQSSSVHLLPKCPLLPQKQT